MKTIGEIKKELRAKANKKKAQLLQGFFKTGKGEYGEGDVFLGVVVPDIRIVAKKYFKETSTADLNQLLKSKFHEERFLALLMLMFKYKKANDETRQKIFSFYLKNTRYINNWDLVDVTCRDIVGWHLFDKDRKVLYKMAQSKNLWERRIAIISTSYFIARGQYNDTMKIAKMLLNDKHDLIHKAVGWMIREIGKRSLKTEEVFLDKHAGRMPRVMLRYAIEKFPISKRSFYLKKASPINLRCR